MKKYYLVLLFLGLLIGSNAQTSGIMKRKLIPGKIDTLLSNYFLYSKLSSLDDVGFSDAIAVQFKNLFTADAKITDEVNPMIYDKNYEHPFDLPIRSVDEYIAKTKENYANGLFLKYKAIQVDYTALSVTMLKETNGTTKTGLNYKITDTLKLKLALSADAKTIKISDIIVMGYSIVLGNDADRDFVPNHLDKCPEEQGFRTVNGCYTKEEKAEIADRKKKERGPSLPGFYIGLTLSGGNNNFTNPFSTNNLGYPSLIKGDKSVNSITNFYQKRQSPFTQFQLDLDYYFGKKKKFGIATGVGFSSFNSSFVMDSFHVEYQSTDGGGNVYRRVLHARAIEEDFKITSINVPIVLQYRFNLGDKTNLVIGLGVNYHSVSAAKVKGSAVADYEAIYNFGNSPGNTTFFDSSATPSGKSWLITRSNIEAHGGKSGEADYFTKKREDGYDVAINQTLTKEEGLDLTSSMGSLLRIGANFKLSEKMWLATLLQFQSVTFTNNTFIKNYQLTDVIGTYNFLLNNVNSMKVNTVSLGIGIKYTIK